MRNIYKLKINYHEYKFNTMYAALRIIKDFDLTEDDYEITLVRTAEEGEPIAKAIRTGLNDDYPDNL